MSRTLIIGGGVIGLSVAYHLGKRSMGDVVLLERNQLTSGTSWHAAGIVGPLRATPNMTRLASHALELFPRLEQETGMSTGYRRTGGYWLAREPDRLDELHRIADLGVTQGLSPQMITPEQIDMPILSKHGIVGALTVPEDANVNPVDLCMAYARAARSADVEIRENTGVARLLHEQGRATGVELSDGTVLTADKVVLCAGAWSRELAATANISLPLQAVEHMYVVTEPMNDLPDPFPVIRDLDRGIYIKGDAGKLVIGGFEPNAKCWDAYGAEGDRPFLEMPEDWDQFMPFMEAALALVPALETAGIQHFMNGPESFTNDTRPLVGEAPTLDGLFIAAGMNSVGVMSSAGIGRALADWIADGAPPFDMWEVDFARVDPKTTTSDHMAHRMQEAVADLFAMHWPYKQPKAGRNLCKSALHDNWAASGAHFGLTAGWERGLWYAVDRSEHALPYSTAAQHWWPIAAREAAEMETGTVLLDLTPFTKLDISGANALGALNQLTTSQMDVETGRAIYTQILNHRGGIEMDVTISRLATQHFHLTSGAATRQRDLAFLRRNMPDCTLTDVTEGFCTIGVMGGGAANLLASVMPDESWDRARLGTVRITDHRGQQLRATRISFVGEYGWELTIANAAAPALFEALRNVGAKPMGHLALDGCRIEKGFKHWSHEIGPDVTPLETGLAFTIDWTKAFNGKDALLRQKAEGLTQRLVLLHIEGNALMLHDEPIYEAGTHVGFTTSGAMGPRTRQNLAFGVISTRPGEPLTETRARQLHVRVAGQDVAATILKRPPFDPKGERMNP
ncbi:MAG: GcvT family protein [Paracoccaceae bacterium]